MKYAWYIDDVENSGMEFCGIEDYPMDVMDAISLTNNTSVYTAYSCPCFETQIEADKVDYGESFDVDGTHSILDEIGFELDHYTGKNYMVIEKEHSSCFEIPQTIKDLYNKGVLAKVSVCKSYVAIVCKDTCGNEYKFLFSDSKNFENKSIIRKMPNSIGESDYYVISDWCKELVENNK